MSWNTFGFSGIGGSYLTANSIKLNQPITTIDNISYIINGTYPFIPGTLKVFINGVSQILGIDYIENADNRSFTWVSPIQISDTASVIVDYII